MLYAQSFVPLYGGQTCFCDLVKVYNSLAGPFNPPFYKTAAIGKPYVVWVIKGWSFKSVLLE